MKDTRILMGMPITIEVVDKGCTKALINEIYDYFQEIDNRYSTYKADSEITHINDGLPATQWSDEMNVVLELCHQTKLETMGYFDIKNNGRIDPSGLVKGWAIKNAAILLRNANMDNFYIEAGGDVEVNGYNSQGQNWSVGIRNPYNLEEIIKVVKLVNKGIATSGTYTRGLHIYNPKENNRRVNELMSLTVIADDVYEADRYATAAFAMGRSGINFINKLDNLEAYMVSSDQVATYTRGFEEYA